MSLKQGGTHPKSSSRTANTHTHYRHDPIFLTLTHVGLPIHKQYTATCQLLISTHSPYLATSSSTLYTHETNQGYCSQGSPHPSHYGTNTHIRSLLLVGWVLLLLTTMHFLTCFGLTPASTPDMSAATDWLQPHALYYAHRARIFHCRYPSLRIGRTKHRTTRGRLRFTDSPEWRNYHLQSPVHLPNTEIFRHTLGALVPGCNPRMNRKRRCSSARKDRHRKLWHRRRRRHNRQGFSHWATKTTSWSLWRWLLAILLSPKGPATSTLSTVTTVHGPRPEVNPPKLPRRNCRLLGGVNLPKVHPDEPLWPYYVAHVHRLRAEGHLTPHIHRTYTQGAFEKLPVTEQYEVFASLGFHFDCPEELLLQLLPWGPEIVQQYESYELPELQLASLTLPAILCHTDILHSQITLLIARRKHIQAELSRLHATRRRDTVRGQPPEFHTTMQAALELYRIRVVINQHKDLIQQLSTRRKLLLRKDVKALPVSIQLPHATPQASRNSRRHTSATLPSTQRSHPDRRWPTPRTHAPMSTTMTVPQRPPLSFPHKMNAADAMDRLLKDLNGYGPMFHNRAPGQAFDVTGGYLTTAPVDGTLATGTLNVDGLDDYKLHMALLLMLHSSLDILVLTDTRHTQTAAAFFKRTVKSHLGGAATLYATETTSRNYGVRQRHSDHARRRSHTGIPTTRLKCPVSKEPGGIIIIIGPKWGPSLVTGRNDDTGFGVLAEVQLRTQRKHVHVLGTYWPAEPTADRIRRPAKNLWSRVHYWLRDRHLHHRSPVAYLQQLAVTWINTALRTDCDAVLLLGDFNSRWLSQENGGNRAIRDWCQDNFLVNGPRQVSDTLRATTDSPPIFTTRGHELDEGTWIDHILHCGHIEDIEVLGAFCSQGIEWEGVTDHRPLWAVYKTALPSTPMPVRPQALQSRVELPLTDRGQVEQFQTRIRRIVAQIPYVGVSDQEAEHYLDNLSRHMVDTVADINAARRRPPASYKDGFSPAFVTHKWHLRMLIEIRRHVLGNKGRRRWMTQRDRRRDLTLLLHTLQARTQSLLISQDTLTNTLCATGKAPEWWLSNDFTLPDVDAEIRNIKRLLHGRRRRDARMAWTRRTAFLEHMREIGATGKIIKTVLKSLAGRKHHTTVNYDTLRGADGTVYVTPEEVQRQGTQHFAQWYALPDAYRAGIHEMEDWSHLLTDYSSFRAQFPTDSQLPEHLYHRIFESLQDIPQADHIRTHLQRELAVPPPYEDFLDKVKNLKSNSSPDISGLSYNMLKRSLSRSYWKSINVSTNSGQ